MKFNVISSGSKGNATLVQTKGVNILIDIGISLTSLNDGLFSRGLGLNDLTCIFISHKHVDHIKSLNSLIKKDSQKRRSGQRDLFIDKLFVPSNIPDVRVSEDQYLHKYKSIKITNDVIVTPLPLSHDVSETFGFLIEDGVEKLVYITDTGYVKDEVLDLIKDATYYIFESNHDTKMLYTSNRTSALISRIHSDHGHLDNVSSASYLSELVGESTKEVVLAHLSEDCNTPSLALETFNKVYKAKRLDEPHFVIKCASASHMTLGGDDA